jgi:membrane-associated phospholipid phosphatase
MVATNSKTSAKSLRVPASGSSSKPAKSIRGYIALSVVCVIMSIPCIRAWDDHWARRSPGFHLPGDLNKAIQLSEAFAHGSGVVAILFTLWWIDISRRKAILLASITTLCAGGVANALKFVFSRIRPHADANSTAIDNWLPLFHGSFWDSTHRSFPSGHAATAVALAIGLSWVYPRGTWLFAVFATAACLQRVTSGAHFPSDVLSGAAIALCTASFIRLWRR